MAYYSVNKTKIKSNINKLGKAFEDKGVDFELFYSVKTNFSEPVLAAVKETGSEFEILSGFEWNKVKNFKLKALVLNGPAKQVELVYDILDGTNLLYFNIDNDADFEILAKINPNFLDKIKIGLRVYLNANGVWNRFGYNIASKEFVETVKKIKSIKKLSGLHFHFSTNNFKISNYQLLLSQIKIFCDSSKTELEFLDIGGGVASC